jgi:site-specific DNA-methyltransferase (adenine-specific)
MSEPRIIHADCLDALRDLPSESVHAVITDPPYGLANTDSTHVVETLSRWFAGERDYLPSGAGFMGKAWDAFVPPPAVWDECYRVLKPGGHLLAFAGTRTVDLMGLSIRLAGFDLRDTITWLYGSGFPKSLDVGKAIDKAAGATREVVGPRVYADGMTGHFSDAVLYGSVAGGTTKMITTPATPDAQQWNGWGTALKPASEPIVMARKPLTGTVAGNVLAHGTGALNIDATRVATTEPLGRPYGGANEVYGKFSMERGTRTGDELTGRWPSNVVLSHASTPDGGDACAGGCVGGCPVATLDQHSGEVSRFFPAFRYQAKAPSKERPTAAGVAHPTVKPLALMQWLVRLVTPPGGTVLEPFAGSGTTVEAALVEGFDVLAIEREAGYLPLIQQRIDRCRPKVLTTTQENQ